MKKTNKNSKVNLDLSCQDINDIIEALLFASSVNIGADWNIEQSESLLNLAITLKNKLPSSGLSLKNITYYEDECLQETWSQKLQQNFNIDSFNVEALEENV